MCTLASMTGVVAPSGCWITDGLRCLPVMHRAYSQCKAKFFNGKNWVLKRNAYFSAGQGVRWSPARQPRWRNVVVAFRRTVTTSKENVILVLDGQSHQEAPDATRVRCGSAAVAGHRARRGRKAVPAVAGARGGRERRRPGAAVAGLHRRGLDRADRPGERGRARDRAAKNSAAPPTRRRSWRR